MNKITIGLAAVVLALSAGLYFSIRGNAALRVERDTAQATLSRTEKELKRVEGILGGVRKEKAAQARKSALDKKALQAAQDAAPEWSRENVPPGVQDALRGALTP